MGTKQVEGDFPDLGLLVGHHLASVLQGVNQAPVWRGSNGLRNLLQTAWLLGTMGPLWEE